MILESLVELLTLLIQLFANLSPQGANLHRNSLIATVCPMHLFRDKLELASQGCPLILLLFMFKLDMIKRLLKLFQDQLLRFKIHVQGALSLLDRFTREIHCVLSLFDYSRLILIYVLDTLDIVLASRSLNFQTLLHIQTCLIFQVNEILF